MENMLSTKMKKRGKNLKKEISMGCNVLSLRTVYAVCYRHWMGNGMSRKTSQRRKTDLWDLKFPMGRRQWERGFEHGIQKDVAIAQDNGGHVC